MNETEVAPQEYPESWDEHQQAVAEGEKKLKLKDGQSIRMHIISGPLTFRELYSEYKDKDGKAKKKRIAVPFTSQLPGYKLRVQYLTEIVILDGPNKGMHKLFQFGKQVADGLEEVKKVWGSTRTPDLIVSRKGSTQFDTEYTVTAGPATHKGQCAVEFDLQAEAEFSKKEDIDSLPKPTLTRSPDSGPVGVSHSQLDFIDGLAKTKELNMKGLNGIIDRKFGKKSVTELTSLEASTLIETIQQM